MTWPNRWSRRWDEARPGCGLVSCSGPKSRWSRIWRHSSGTYLQGVFYCQPRCLEIALTAQLARLQALAPAAPTSSRIPLGLLMVARGWLTYEQVVSALATQQSAGAGKIGDWFEDLGYATGQQVTSALALQWGCPVASSLEPAISAPFATVPFGILEAFQMLPLHFIAATNTMSIAFGERVDHAALYTIEKILACRTQPCVGGRKNVAAELDRMRQQPRPGEVVFGPMHDCAEIGRVATSYIAKLGADRVRLGRIGQFIWLRLEARASHSDLLFGLTIEKQSAQDAPKPPLPTGTLPAASASRM